jgi:hypothetical protein
LLHDRAGCRAAWCAFVLGVASAAVSAYWAAGGTALLDTVGGSIERWGRERSLAVLVVLVAVAALKLVVAVAAPLAAGAFHAPAWMAGRVPRLLSWIAAGTLALYGGVLTAAGLLVQSGVIEPGPEADRHALAWHTWFWDPWFLLWGVAFVVALWRTSATANG